jgi:hypothetical protein
MPQVEQLAVRLGLPSPRLVLESVLAMDAADTAEFSLRWITPGVITEDNPDPVWRPPTLLPLPQSHQVPHPPHVDACPTAGIAVPD